MSLRGMVEAIRAPELRGMTAMMSAARTVSEIHFLHAALDAGLLRALAERPRTEAELIDDLGVARPELLEALLEVGLALEQLRCSEGRYRLKGKLARTIARPEGDGLAALVEAQVTYYNSIYRHLGARIRDEEELGDYLPAIGEVVARFSALTDPFFSEALRTSTRGRGPIHVLDVGCGSGTHLKRMGEHNAEATGVGFDLDPAVVRLANANLQSWGLAERFHALEGDAVATDAREAAGPFDLITLLNVIYYFPVEERSDVLSRLRARLHPGGELLIACTMVEPGRRDLWAANLDMATRSMIGCEPLPKLDELCNQLEEAGFAHLRKSRVVPGGSVFALRATPRRDSDATRSAGR